MPAKRVIIKVNLSPAMQTFDSCLAALINAVEELHIEYLKFGFIAKYVHLELNKMEIVEYRNSRIRKVEYPSLRDACKG